MAETFEIYLGGMVYVFSSDRLYEIIDMLDACADDVHPE